MVPRWTDREKYTNTFLFFCFYKDCVHRKWCRYFDHSTVSYRQLCKGERRPIPESAANNSSAAVQLTRIDDAPPVVVVARQRPGLAREMAGSWQFISGGRSGCEAEESTVPSCWLLSRKGQRHAAGMHVGSSQSYSLMSLQHASL